MTFMKCEKEKTLVFRYAQSEISENYIAKWNLARGEDCLMRVFAPG